MHRYRVVATSLIVALTLGGCGNRTEMNELGITTATGFDGHKGNWTVTYQVITPSAIGSGGASGGGGSQAAVHTFSTQGRTIREAVAANSLENPRRLYFAHTNTVLIGKQAAEDGIAEIIDNYYRNPDARQTVKVFIADGEASTYLKKLIPPEKLPGQALAKILQKNKQMSSVYPSISIHELALKISSDSGAAGVPEISIKGGGDSEKLESMDVFNQTAPASKLKLSRLSIFKKDKKVASLNQKKSMTLSWLTNQVDTTTLSSEDEHADLSAYLIRKAKVTVTPVKGPQRYTLQVNANVSGELVETSTDEAISTPQGMNRLQQQAEEVIEAQIREGWEDVQKLNIDLLGIANKIHRKYPKDWKQLKGKWPDEMANMDIDINVKVNILRPGLFQNSFSKLLETEE
jgi:spore germination protein KC